MTTITVLNDNVAGALCGSEHGLSFLVESDIKFLFDAGPSDIFIKNAEKLKVDLEDINIAILSHGHWDHADGFAHLQNMTLLTHPNSFVRRFRKSKGTMLGTKMTRAEFDDKFEVLTSKDPISITENTIFLGEIPRKNDFESKTTFFQFDNGEEDFITDDSGIVIKTEKGLILLSGCAHSGICNMIDHAMKITGESKVYAIVGGFHIHQAGTILDKTVKHLKRIGVQKIYPSHCTGFEALKALSVHWNFPLVKSGNTIRM